ncbi:hypothetical protein C7U92_26065 [Bradyrhizobium sp. WBOS7]|uniref:Uncharacterized protein n=1 Tax=Bradyrhizobium betae TaxID=244734 RepID=A0AAE9SU36_9BRAD|nr:MULTISPECIES: hypothetical protein [Bradyrhizobium]MDD1574170.1 hypothetical protein [Bradyrhizobium sp. WBOS1]UUO38559.1 hypothetical protein DCK84_30880 [Bradyrhizobium sp. WBOS01]UUO44727.1 hypothetical protein DCM75_30855 [Bradyrhizobium sp. WBOS02]UUO55135.1 hypothetical protein DCM79_20450 [Bradyrhizobium sp. WBOS07]UUO69192.1 hypothetical protein DCM83_30900 [Bradyrhizobium betae]
MKPHSPSRAANEANSHFKQQAAAKPATDYEKAEQAFQANRERLKAERLAREAELRSRSERTP